MASKCLDCDPWKAPRCDRRCAFTCAAEVCRDCGRYQDPERFGHCYHVNYADPGDGETFRAADPDHALNRPDVPHCCAGFLPAQPKKETRP